MADLNLQQHSNIMYRPIRPSDLEALELIHGALFPISYEPQFFLDVVNGHGIVSWAAVDISRPDNQSDELIGFITARITFAKESELDDMVHYESSWTDKTLVYILTLGVIEGYRKLGIASALVRQVIKYASSMPSCRAVYLHVIDYNVPAIHFYEKMMFECVRRLSKFYYIGGQHYDSYLFVYYVNGGRSPCSPLYVKTFVFLLVTLPRDLVASVAKYTKKLFASVSSRLWKNELPISRWADKCKERKIFVRPSDNDGCLRV